MLQLVWSLAVVVSGQASPAQDAPMRVPDVVVSRPEPDSVWCVRNPPRHSSRTRGAVCRTWAEWRAIGQAAHDQNDVVYRRRDPLLIDTRLTEAAAVGERRQAERARAQREAREAVETAD